VRKLHCSPFNGTAFLAGGKTYFYVIPPFAPRKPKPAEVIPISTEVSDAGEAAKSTRVSRPGKGRNRSKKTVARESSKKARILVLLKRPTGATIDDIMHVTGWQAHTVRGFISGHLIKRMGLKVNSTRRSGGTRSYQIMRG
jgi:hypothetical protein